MLIRLPSVSLHYYFEQPISSTLYLSNVFLPSYSGIPISFLPRNSYIGI